MLFLYSFMISIYIHSWRTCYELYANGTTVELICFLNIRWRWSIFSKNTAQMLGPPRYNASHGVHYSTEMIFFLVITLITWEQWNLLGLSWFSVVIMDVWGHTNDWASSNFPSPILASVYGVCLLPFILLEQTDIFPPTVVWFEPDVCPLMISRSKQPPSQYWISNLSRSWILSPPPSKPLFTKIRFLLEFVIPGL